MVRRTLILSLVLALPVLGGCYERVVASKGLGSMGTSVQSSYRSNTAADRAYDSMWGPEPKKVKGADNMPVTGHATWTTDSSGRSVGP